MRRKLVTTLLASLAIATLSAGPALADHTHVLLLGNGQCVILAANGNEKYVELPHADDFAENRRHPLHVNVHLGEAGERNGHAVIFVQGSQADLDNCDGYVNG